MQLPPSPGPHPLTQPELEARFRYILARRFGARAVRGKKGRGASREELAEVAHHISDDDVEVVRALLQGDAGDISAWLARKHLSRQELYNWVQSEPHLARALQDALDYQRQAIVRRGRVIMAAFFILGILCAYLFIYGALGSILNVWNSLPAGLAFLMPILVLAALVIAAFLGAAVLWAQARYRRYGRIRNTV